MPLERQLQDDWAAGIVRATARHLVPENGLYNALELLLDDDGSLYERGGSRYHSNAAFGSAGLLGLWDLQLGPGVRTLFANSSDFGVLDSDDATPINLGGSGIANPARVVVMNGMAFIPGGTIYGGSRKTANYSTGTVTVTNGSKTVTGAGTTWNTLVDAGMLFQRGAERYYEVASIDSTTSLTLRDAYQGVTGAGASYTLAVLGSVGGLYRNSQHYAVAGDRLIADDGGDRVYESDGRDATTGQLQPHSFQSDNYHEFPARVLGFGGVRDRLIAFTAAGGYVITNIALDLTDDFGNAQQQAALAYEDLQLWSHEGIASYGGGLVAPCTDGVYLLDGVSGPTKLSSSITPLIGGYVRSGYKTGQAVVYKSHYFLPVLSNTNAIVDLLVCRLDRPTRSRLGTIFPWTRIGGHGGNVSAVERRIDTAGRNPELLAASLHSGSRVLKLSSFFEPAAAYKADADGTTHGWRAETRDVATNAGGLALVRRARAFYELEDAASDDPKVSLAWSNGVPDNTGLSLWDTAVWDTDTWEEEDAGEWHSVSGQAPENDGRDPYVWPMNIHQRFVRFKLSSSDPSAKFTLRAFGISTRPSPRY